MHRVYIPSFMSKDVLNESYSNYNLEGFYRDLTVFL